jgi:hypothetical protein
MSVIRQDEFGFEHEEEEGEEIQQSSLPTSSYVVSTEYADVEATEAVTLAKTSIDFLAGIALPEIYKYVFPPVYLSVWLWILEFIHKTRDFSQLALGLPRGFGKTLVIKLVILYAILFTNKRFILVVSEIEDKAISILSDVADMLNEPNIKALFGDWTIGIQINQQSKKVFSFRGRQIILKAAGAGTGIRGIVEKNVRPDLMIFDDIQSREDSESEILSQNLEKWLVGTAMKAKSPEGCLFLFVANMYPTKGSLLRKLKQNSNWVKFIAGGILADGSSLWEELQPIEQLLREFQNDLATGHPEIFYSEVLNDENASVNSAIDLSKIPDYNYKDDDIPSGSYIIIDPANAKSHSDATAIGYFEVHNGLANCRDLIEEKLSPGATIMTAIKMAFRWKTKLIAIESNAYQYSLLYWFNFICQQQGISGLEVRDIYSGSSAKTSRILSMFKQLVILKDKQLPEIGLHPSVRSLVYVQIMQYNPLRRDNTDGILDLLTYAPKVLEMYPAEVMMSNIIENQESDAMEVLDNNCVF